jgi:uncharacterized protein YdhG (YjbR/CyaY superfamily)
MRALQSENIDEYIAGFPAGIRAILEQVRVTVKEAAPDATEAISYGMPTFILNGNRVYFGAFKKHLGFFPTPAGVESFEKELSAYKTGRGSIQFPYAQPMPLALIKKIVKFQMQRQKSPIKKSKG